MKFVEASRTMMATLKCPEVWRPCVYMYMSLALSVDIQEGMFYWYTDRNAGLSFSEVYYNLQILCYALWFSWPTWE
jgi:hypothetical protein